MDQDQSDSEAVQQGDIAEQPVDVASCADLAGDDDDHGPSVVGVDIGRRPAQGRDEGLAVEVRTVVGRAVHERDSNDVRGGNRAG